MASRHGIATILLVMSCAAHAQGEAPEVPEEAPVEQPAPANDFLKRFQAAEGSFSREGTAKGLAALEALAAEPSLNPAQTALVQSRLGARYGFMNERNRANRHMANAREARKAATPEQVAALGVDLDARMLVNEAAFEALKGNTLEAARLQRLAERRIWENVRLLSADKASPAYAQARSAWMATVVDSVQFNIRAGRLSEYRDYAKSLGEDSTGLTARSRSRAAAAQARALLAAGDHEAALAQADRALKLHAEARELDSGLTVQTSRSTRVIALASLERFDECVADAQVALAQFADRAVAGAFSLPAAKGFEAACRRDFGAAEQFANESLEYRLKVYGREHYLTKEATGQVLFFRLQHSDIQGSVGAIASLVDRVAGSSRQWADSQESPQHSVRPVMTKVLDGIHAMVAAGRQPDARLAELGFRITEYMKLSASQGALFDGAARLAAKTPELRELVEREQALKGERATAMTRAYRAGNALEKTSKAETVNKDELAKQQKALKAAEGKLAESENAIDNVRRELTSRFPEYREMVNPTPLTLDETRALLRNGEVYVSQYATSRSGLVWIVDRTGLVRVLPSAPRAEASALAARYRASTDSLESAARTPDFAAGTKLREALLGDATAIPAAARTLIVSTDPLLSAVPLQALPMGDKAWVMQRWAVTALPGATSLKLLRARRGGGAAAPLAAFGDPAFSPSTEPPPSRVRTLLRAQQSSFDYSSIPPLPETRDEVVAVAAALRATGPGSVFLGREATRSAVLGARLDDRQVVLFSTHGVKPGDIPRLTKAGLAMAYEGEGLADSMLTTDDIVGLKLNADWVVLSACNSGANDPTEDQTLSSLTRAFFLAGSRSLLVTHWAVESESAKRLVVETFKQYAAGREKAEALAIAQRAMAAGELGKEFTHPFFWAAYYLAGEPAR